MLEHCQIERWAAIILASSKAKEGSRQVIRKVYKVKGVVYINLYSVLNLTIPIYTPPKCLHFAFL